jgi:hypothetical protein
VGEANHAVTRRLESCVTGTVALESSTMAMEGKTVQLDNEALLRPERIDLEVEQRNVDPRGGKPVLSAQGDEQILERRARGAAALFGYEASDRGESALPRPRPRARS